MWCLRKCKRGKPVGEKWRGFKKREGRDQIRNGLDTVLCTDPEHGSQWCVSDCFPFA